MRGCPTEDNLHAARVRVSAARLAPRRLMTPGVAQPAAPAPLLPGVVEPERLTPVADGFVRDRHASLRGQIFYISEAQAEAVIQPDRVADDFRWKSVPSVAEV